MLLGGWRALRQFDLKLLLAYGTVSQLGFLHGGRSASAPGPRRWPGWRCWSPTRCSRRRCSWSSASSTTSTGTRDLRAALRGRPVRRRCWPAAALLAGASMAGLPPLAGFVAKESVYGALLDVARTATAPGSRAPPAGPCWSAWSSARRSPSPTPRGSCGAPSPPSPASAAPTPAGVPAGFLAAPGRCSAALVARRSASLGGAGDHGARAVRRHVPGRRARRPTLALWHGLGPAAGAVAASRSALGLLLFWTRDAVRRAAGARSAAPWSAERGYFGAMRLLDRAAVEVTGAHPARLGGDLPRRDPGGRRAAPGLGAVLAAADGPVRGGRLGQRGAGGGRRDHRGRRGAHRPVPPPAARRSSWSASPATAPRCCSCCTARPTWR